MTRFVVQRCDGLFFGVDRTWVRHPIAARWFESEGDAERGFRLDMPHERDACWVKLLDEKAMRAA